MEDLDKMMACLGFDEEKVKHFVSAIPFESKKRSIMKQIKKNELATSDECFYPLIFVLAIAFAVLVIRCATIPQGDSTVLVSFLTSVVFSYSELLLVCFKVLSLAFSVLICAGIYFLAVHLKNEQRFM
jgi:uncharacterized membrane protein YciS (DUF1049 family)